MSSRRKALPEFYRLGKTAATAHTIYPCSVQEWKDQVHSWDKYALKRVTVRRDRIAEVVILTWFTGQRSRNIFNTTVFPVFDGTMPSLDPLVPQPPATDDIKMTRDHFHRWLVFVERLPWEANTAETWADAEAHHERIRAMVLAEILINGAPT